MIVLIICICVCFGLFMSGYLEESHKDTTEL